MLSIARWHKSLVKGSNKSIKYDQQTVSIILILNRLNHNICTTLIIIMNKIGSEYRSSSFNHTPLKQIRTIKLTRALSKSIAKLRQIKSTYELPMLRHRQRQQKTEDQSSHHFSTRDMADFNKKSKQLCQDVCFHMGTFAKLHGEDHRKKSMLAKIYGWDQHFNQIFFAKREEIRHDLNPQMLHLKLGLDTLTVVSRNTYNKLRLFLNELILNNKHQQELQSSYMKAQLENRLSKVSAKISEIKLDPESKNIMTYIDQIAKTQELMLESKLKIRNKMPNIMQISSQTGRVHINEFYIKQEGSIATIQQYITLNHNQH